MPDGPTRLGCLLPSEMMTGLAERARQQEELLRIVRETLPPDLAVRCVACALRGQQLVVLSESTPSLFHLRFQRELIEAALQRQGHPEIVSVSFKVAAPSGNRQAPIRKATIPSPDIANLLLEVAPGGAPDRLTSSLQRLGQTLAGMHTKKGPPSSP